MRVLLLVVALVAVGARWVVPGVEPPPEVPPERIPRYYLNGVTVGMTRDRIVGQWGEPLSEDGKNLVRWQDTAVEFSRERAYRVWGTCLTTARASQRLVVGDTRERVLRDFPHAESNRPHPQQIDHWQDIYVGDQVVEDPSALELLFLDDFEYGKGGATSRAIVYAVVTDGRVTSINVHHSAPCGKRRYYTSP